MFQLEDVIDGNCLFGVDVGCIAPTFTTTSQRQVFDGHIADVVSIIDRNCSFMEGYLTTPSRSSESLRIKTVRQVSRLDLTDEVTGISGPHMKVKPTMEIAK
jgi:hypothetical protein